MNEPIQSPVRQGFRFSQVRPEDAAAVLIVAAFAAAGFVGLDAVPRVHADECWNAAPGYSLATRGLFATDLFTGFFGAERHWFGFLPVYPAVVGLFLRLFGFGLLQARAASLALASVTLVLTYLVGRKLLSPRAGLLAVLILAAWPIGATGPFHPTGIPLADLGRIVRYDVAVPAFGLAALLALAASFSSGILPTAGRCLLAGGFAGLAALSHAYGVAWLPALALASVWAFGRAGLRTWPPLAAGSAAILAPWAAAVLSNLEDFLGQNRSFAGRVQMFRPGFYLENLLTEPGRFGPVLEALRSGSPAAILFVLTTAAGLLLLVRRAVLSKDRPARLLVAVAAVLAAAFAAVLRPKMFWYLGTIWPVLALAASSVLSRLVERGRPCAVRLLACVAIAAATVQGGSAALRVAREARSSTPYGAIASRLRAGVPPDGRLLLQPHWWLALGQRPGPTQCLFVPILLAHPAYARQAVPVEETLRRFPPDLVLVDGETKAFLGEERPAGDPGRGIRQGLSDYISSHRTGSEVVLDDPGYGRFELVRLSESGRAAAPERTGTPAPPGVPPSPDVAFPP